MSEPFAERLSRFTPDATGLNRDALLFAAGRASVRPNRRWQALAAVLAASQLVLLVSLWGETKAPQPPAPIAPFALPKPPDAPQLLRDPSDLWVLSVGLPASESDGHSQVGEGPMIAPKPPLRVFDPLPAKYLN